MTAWRSALRIRDPGLVFLRSAGRAAIVMPAARLACAVNLDAEAHAARASYVTFGDALVGGTTVPPLELPESVEVLARPDQVERGSLLRHVPALQRFAHAVDQSTPSVGVAPIEEHLGREAATA